MIFPVLSTILALAVTCHALCFQRQCPPVDNIGIARLNVAATSLAGGLLWQCTYGANICAYPNAGGVIGGATCPAALILQPVNSICPTTNVVGAVLESADDTFIAGTLLCYYQGYANACEYGVVSGAWLGQGTSCPAQAACP